LNPEALSEDMYISWLVLNQEMTRLGESAVFHWTDLTLLAPSRSPLRVSLDIIGRDVITTAGDAERHLFLVGAYAALVDSVREGLKARAVRGVTLPRVLLPRAQRFARALRTNADSSLPLAFVAESAGLDSAGRAQFATRLQETITASVNPALDRLVQFLEGEYAAQGSDRIGLWQYTGGKEHYRYLVQSYSTLDITPENAHAIGLREIARLEALASGARARLGYPATPESLRARLTSDPRVTVGSPGEVLGAVPDAYGRAAATMGRAFTRATEYTADVQALSPPLEEDGPLAEYVPPSARDPHGHYLINTKRWFERSLVRLPAHTYGDLLPGRHYQLALQLENDSLPPFRRLGTHAGFVDGWATYALALTDSLLADEGVGHFGAVLEELALACGLVADTGINYFGWSWNDALTFLRSHLPESDEELAREILIPAIELPGSLTAATLGAREFRSLRSWAEKELGKQFDVRSFHDEVLSVGAVPLPALGAHLEWWLWKQRQKLTSPDTRDSFDTSRSAAKLR
jgi:uncharacterized protein (DUF885 family)